MSNFRHFFPILELLSNIWQYYLLLDTVVQYLTVLLAFRHYCPIFDSITCFWTLLSNIWQYYLLLDTIVQYLTVLLAFGHYCPIFDSITCFWTLLSNIWQYYLLLDTIVQYLTVLLAFGHYCPNFGQYFLIEGGIIRFLEAIAQVRAIQYIEITKPMNWWTLTKS